MSLRTDNDTAIEASRETTIYAQKAIIDRQQAELVRLRRELVTMSAAYGALQKRAAYFDSAIALRDAMLAEARAELGHR